MRDDGMAVGGAANDDCVATQANATGAARRHDNRRRVSRKWTDRRFGDMCVWQVCMIQPTISPWRTGCRIGPVKCGD